MQQMGDLYLAMAAVTIISVGVLAAMVRAARGWSRSVLLLSLLFGIGWLTLYVKYVMDSPAIARLMPVSSAIILGNWTPILACGLAGLSWRAIGGSTWRPGITLIPLMGFAFYSAWWPVFSPRPATQDKEQRGVWLQSTRSTCTPAAAATLLAAHGIRTTETEMTQLCLTTHHGTSLLGLYRGLTLKTAGGPLQVEFITTNVDGLKVIDTPMVITCGIRHDQQVDMKYIMNGDGGRAWNTPWCSIASSTMTRWRSVTQPKA